MPSLPTLSPQKSILLRPEPLTPAAFSPFGTAIASPVPADQTVFPSSPVPPQHGPHQPTPQPANQNTALKTSPISPLTNNYPAPDSTDGVPPSHGLMSIFSSFPRRNLYFSHSRRDDGGREIRLKIAILERHPYTTQTFCPFSFSAAPQSTGKSEEEKTYFLVVVAPTLDLPDSDPPNPPDLSRIRAFLAPTTVDAAGGNAGFAVTYGPGTWHAPMIVLGRRRVDFLVSQFVNGRPDDDCQEVLVGSGDEIVEVGLDGLGLRVYAGGDEAKVGTRLAKL